MQKRFDELAAKLLGDGRIGAQEGANALMELGEIEKRLAYLQREIKSLKGSFEGRKTRILDDEAKNGNDPVASTEKGGKGADVKAGK